MPATMESAEVILEDMRRRDAALQLLRDAKISARYIYGFWEPLESDRFINGDRVGVIIFLDSMRQPKTALVRGAHINVCTGWDGDPRVARISLPSDEG